MKALVVGGSGATGPILVQGLLTRGYEVSFLYRGAHEAPLPVKVGHIHTDPHFLETIQETLGSRTFDLVIALLRSPYFSQMGEELQEKKCHRPLRGFGSWT